MEDDPMRTVRRALEKLQRMHIGDKKFHIYPGPPLTKAIGPGVGPGQTPHETEESE